MNSPFAELLDRLAITLLHSLWIGGLIVVLLASLLATVFRNRSPHFRGRLAEFALLSFAISVFGIFLQTGLHAPVVLGPPVARGGLSVSEVSLLQPSNTLGTTHWIALTWILGAGISIFRRTLGWLRLHRLCRRSEPVRDSQIVHAFQKARARLGIRERVSLRVSSEIEAPMMAGVLWPTVLIPLSLLQGAPVSYLQAIFAHELAHHRRWDYLVNLGFQFLGALFFYHPAIWWMLRVIETERERACDDLAISKTRERCDYIRALAWLELNRSEHPNDSFLPAPALRLRPGSTAERMERLVRGSQPRQDRFFGSRPSASFAALISAIAVALSFSPEDARGTSSTNDSDDPPAWMTEIRESAAVVRRCLEFLEKSPSTWTDDALLFSSPITLEKNGKLIRLDQPEPRAFPEFPNQYLLDHRLNFLDGNLPSQDPDGDGFSILEEYEAGTDPRSAESFPPLTDKLHFVSRKVQLYRASFDARPDGRQAQLTRHPSAIFGRDVFAVSEGDLSPDGKLRVESISDQEVQVRHLDTDTAHVLPKREVVEIPTWFAEFRFALGNLDEVFFAKEGSVFSLPPSNGENRYRLEKVEEDGASIIPLDRISGEAGSPIQID